VLKKLSLQWFSEHSRIVRDSSMTVSISANFPPKFLSPLFLLATRPSP
jgi:hypothetical protein